MNEHMLELGVGGIFALMILNIVLPYFRKNGGNGYRLDEARHDQLVELIKSVNVNISAQTAILRDVCKECFRTRTEVIAEIRKTKD